MAERAAKNNPRDLEIAGISSEEKLEGTKMYNMKNDVLFSMPKNMRTHTHNCKNRNAKSEKELSRDEWMDGWIEF